MIDYVVYNVNGEKQFTAQIDCAVDESDSWKKRLAVFWAIENKKSLKGAYLYMANLYRANLYMANLTEANLDGANLEVANLDGANLEGANEQRNRELEKENAELKAKLAKIQSVL